MEHKTAYEEALKQKEQDSSFHGRENDATSLKVSAVMLCYHIALD
jgi:hypothetical protein